MSDRYQSPTTSLCPDCWRKYTRAEAITVVGRWEDEVFYLYCPHDNPLSSSAAPRDDGAPTVVALLIALADAQTAFRCEDDRHAALGWLASHISSLIADSARLKELDAQREAMYRAGPPSAPPHTGASNE